MKNFILKCLLFSVLVMSLLLLIDTWFLNNDQWDVASFNSLYEAEDNEVDIVLIGSSHLNKGIDPFIVDALCKTNTIKISGGGLTIAQMYYNLKEALKIQNPKLVVMETFSLLEPHSTNNNLFDANGNLKVRPFNSEYYKRFGKVKYTELSKIYPENTLYHLFNSFRFHEVWTDMDQLSSSLNAKFASNPQKINQEFNRTLSTLGFDKVNTYKTKSFSTEKIFISKDEKYFLNKIIKLSKTENFKLLFFTTPILNIYYNKTKEAFQSTSNELESILKKNNIKYFDINQVVGGFNATHFVDGNVTYNQHLNYKGIIKTSNILSKFINKNYKFKSLGNTDINSPEDILYRKNTIEKNRIIYGNIETVNNQKYLVGDSLTNTIIIPKNKSTVHIEGWLLRKGINKNESIRKLAFKKNNNFFIITQGDLQEMPNDYAASRFGKNYQMSGFKYTFNKKAFDKGKYKIYGIIETEDKSVMVRDMWKWIVIK